MDDVVGQWLNSQAQDMAVAVDGESLRGSIGLDGKRVHLLTAFLQREKMVIAQQQVDKKATKSPLLSHCWSQ